jgi:DNA-binding protein HU-beta
MICFAFTFTQADGKKVSFTGFGTFESRERAARQGRNPQTGEALDIKASRSPAFSASKTFKDKVKEKK